jgi:hypothetical protein
MIRAAKLERRENELNYRKRRLISFSNKNKRLRSQRQIPEDSGASFHLTAVHERSSDESYVSDDDSVIST